MNINASATFSYHWGPFLHRTQLPESECAEIVGVAKLATRDHSANLAGVIGKEFLFDEKERRWFEEKLSPYFWEYSSARSSYHGHEVLVSSLRLDEVWINIMQPGEFNPPHNHFGGDTSFVLYLQIPEGLEAEFRDNNRNNSGPGAVEFCYGQPDWWVNTSHAIFPKRGDLLIFPAPLLHFVQPYASPGERISIAGNIQSTPSPGVG